LLSIEECLDTTNYPRLRIGVGAPPTRNIKTFVLAAFSDEEREILADILARSIDGIDAWIKQGIEAAMNRVNAIGKDAQAQA